MKKLFLSAALAVSASLGASAQFVDGSIFDDAQYYVGSSWSYRSEIQDKTAKSFTKVFVQFNNVDNVTVPAYLDMDPMPTAMKVKISGPAGYEYSSFPQSVRDSYTYEVVPNAISFSVSSMGVNTPGTYTCVFPAGCFKVDGVDLPESTVELYVLDTRQFTPIDIDFTPSPDPVFDQKSIAGVGLRYNQNFATGGRRFTPEAPSQTIFPYFEKEDGTKIEAKASNGSSMVGTGSVEIVPTAVITEPGEYTLVVPEGVIRLQDAVTEGSSSVQLVCNKELKYTYTITGDNGYEAVNLIPKISPAPGNVARLSQITFESPNDDIDMYLPDTLLPLTVKFPGGTEKRYNPYTNQNVAGLFAYVNLGDDATTPGTYSVTVPRGFFEYWDGSNYTVNKEFSFNYQLVEVTSRDFEYTANPANGSTVYVLYDPTVTFVDKNLTFSTGTKATLIRPNGDSEQIYLSFNTTDSKITIGPIYTSEGIGDQKVEYYGEYKILIPANTVMDENGSANNEFTLTYTYAERLPRDIAFTVTPAEGEVNDLDMVTLKAPADVAKIERSSSGITQSFLRTPSGESYQCYIKEVSNNPMAFRIEPKPEEVEADGEYAWVVPEGSFRIVLSDGSECLNTQNVFTWTVTHSGVEGIFADGATYDVYTLDGQVVLKNASAAELRDLKGFYVINGKNYFLK